MGLNWPSIHSASGNLEGDQRQAIRVLLDEFGEIVEVKLGRLGLPLHTSPLWRPWSVLVIRDAEKVLCAFSALTGGIASIEWLDLATTVYPADQFAGAVKAELGRNVNAIVVLALPGAANVRETLESAAMQHASEVERSASLGRLGDLSGVGHLEPHLRDFLNDHPEPERNVFVMMRFLKSGQLDEAHTAIKKTLAARGFHAVRADDRDYTGELWSNIEVHLTCCKYGIAVFEDIEKRDFNPNVSLELGYMLGRRKRCLILKEQRLPDLPADVIHRLYKPFDMFSIEQSVTREVARWIDVDLGLSVATP